jgi:hypothetical protein
MNWALAGYRLDRAKVREREIWYDKHESKEEKVTSLRRLFVFNNS